MVHFVYLIFLLYSKLNENWVIELHSDLKCMMRSVIK
jgi:hypothetical protein